MRRFASLRAWILLGFVPLIALTVHAQEMPDGFAGFRTSQLSSQGREEGRAEADGEDERIETDRDSFTPATTTAPSGRLIYESSYSFLDNRNTANTHSFPEIITRYGLADHVELRLGWNYEVGGGGSVSGGDSGGEDLEAPGRVRETQMLYGLKLGLTDQDGWIPRSACIIQGTTPTSGPDPFTDLQISYVYGWKIFKDWQLDSSIRYLSTEEDRDHFNTWAPSAVLKVPVAERWYAHAEYFGLFSSGKAKANDPQYFSPGIHYLISPDVEVGVRVGWGLNPDAANFFVNVGFGLQF